MINNPASGDIPLLTKKPKGLDDKKLSPILKLIEKSNSQLLLTSKEVERLSKAVKKDKENQSKIVEVLKEVEKNNKLLSKKGVDSDEQIKKLNKLILKAEEGTKLSQEETTLLITTLSKNPKYKKLVKTLSKEEKAAKGKEKREGKEKEKKEPGWVLTKLIPQMGRTLLGPANLIAETFTQYAYGKDMDELLSDKITKGIEKRRERKSSGGGKNTPLIEDKTEKPLSLPVGPGLSPGRPSDFTPEKAPMNPTKSQVSKAGEIGALYIVQELSKSLGVTTPAQKKSQGNRVKEKFITKQIKAGPFVTKAYSAGRGIGAFFEGILEGLGSGLNKLAKGKALKGAFVLTLVGASIVGIGWAISTFVKNVDLASVAIVSLALIGLGLVTAYMGKQKGILKGALVLAIIGGILVGVAWALAEFSSKIDPLVVIAIAGSMAVLGGAMALLGKLPIPVILQGALALVLVGAALGIAFGIIGLVMSLLPEDTPKKMTSFAGALLSFANPQLLLLLGVAPAIVAFSLSLLLMAPGILLAGGAFALVGDSLMKNLSKFGELDGGKLSSAAGGIIQLSGALLAFGGGQLGGALANLGSSILNFFAGDPIDKLQKFADMSDPLQKTAQAMLDISTSIEKFANRDIMDAAANNLLNVGNSAVGIYPKVMAGNVLGTGEDKGKTPNASVNDAIIKSDGTIIETSPDDNLIATKSPIQSLPTSSGDSTGASIDMSKFVPMDKVESLLQELITVMKSKSKESSSDKPYNFPNTGNLSFAMEREDRLL